MTTTELIQKYERWEKLRIYRNIVTAISHLNLQTMEVEVSVSFRSKGLCIKITAFCLFSDNTTLHIFDFYNPECAERAAREAVRLLRQDKYEILAKAGFSELCLHDHPIQVEARQAHAD